MSALRRFWPKGLRLGHRSVIGVPYVWLLFFFAVPFAILLRISVTDMGDQLDPFAAILHDHDGRWRLILKLSNYFSLFQDEDGILGNTLYTEAYWLSIRYAFWTTVLCLLLGYPFAYFMSKAPESRRPLLLLMVMLPFWTSFLLRVYAWKGILADSGTPPNALHRCVHAGGHDLCVPALHGAAAVRHADQN
jgi:putrescine transport system permease protein